MSKILIVGNSSEVIHHIKKAREQEPTALLTLFCTESLLPYDRWKLPSYLAKDIKEALVYPEHDRFFVDHQVEVVSNEKLARVSLKRKYLTTESKRQISYDKLILLDTGFYKIPDIKGHHKKGVFSGFSLSQIKELQKWLIEAETIFLTVRHFQGLNLACALAKLKKEVIISAPEGILSHVLDDEAESLLKQILEAQGIRFVDQDIEEILGDMDVKAVRLKSGKVMSAQAVIVDDVTVDVSMLSDTQPGDQDLWVKEEFLRPPALPLIPVHFGLGLLDGFAIGVTYLPEGGKEFLRFNGPDNVFKKIYVLHDQLVGAVIYNAPSFIHPLSDLIISGASIAGREESLLEMF